MDAQTPQVRSPRYRLRVADIAKNARERLRVELLEYKGRDLASIRIWIANGDGGDAIPSQKGVTIAANLVPELHRALAEAERLAIQRGILPAPTSS